MPSIFSWMPRAGFERPTVALAACCLLSSAALAETAAVRLGSYFKDAAGYPMTDFGSLAGVLRRQNLSVQLFVRNAKSCQDLLAVPLDEQRGYDRVRSPYMIIQSIGVECWAVLEFDPATQVRATGPDDRITPDVIHGIVADAKRRSGEDQNWARAVIALPGGTITCRNDEQCRLSIPEWQNPPEWSLDFDLIIASGDERFIKVIQTVYGRSSFVYGVRWRANAGGGEVISIFPALR